MRLEGVEGAESPTGVGHRLRRSRVAFYVQRIGTTNRKVASAVPARTLIGCRAPRGTPAGSAG